MRCPGGSLALAVLVFSSPVAQAQEEAAEPQAPAEAERTEPLDEESLISEEPIVMELAQGLDLLDEQIATQEGLLKTAQTERERRLIENHIRLLQKERRSFQSLLHKLVGPDFESLMRETQEELGERRAEQLEKAAEAATDRAAESD